MKRIIISILIIILSASLYGGLLWENNGVPIRQGENIEWSRSAVKHSDGSVVISWSDTRMGDRDLFAQKIMPDGNVNSWGESGVAISSAIDRQEDVVSIGCSDGATIFAWIDFREDKNGDIYAQKVDSNGSPLWADGGVPLCIESAIQISLNIVSDDNGGAYLIWLDKRNGGGSDIYGTHLLSSGEVASGIGSSGKPLVEAAGTQTSHSFRKDGNGSCIAVWIDGREDSNKQIYAQKIGAGFTPEWGENGKAMANIPGDSNSIKLIMDSEGNFVVYYKDRTTETDGDISAIKFDSDGNDLWGGKKVVYGDDAIQGNPRTCAGDNGSTIVVWQDGRNVVGERDLYVQKLDSDGNRLWGDSGVEISIAANDQQNPRISSDGSGGAWIIWEDRRDDIAPFGDLYMEHISSDGTLQFGDGGSIVSNSDKFQSKPLIRFADDKVFTVWSDGRSGSVGLRTSIYNSDGSSIAVEEPIFSGLDGDGKDYRTLKIDDNRTGIFWVDTRNGTESTQIFFQYLNSDGEILLPRNGKSLTEHRGNTQEGVEVTFSEENSKILSVWEEIVDGTKEGFFQLTDLDGNSQITPYGGELAADNYQNKYLQTTSHGGYYYVGWTNADDDPYDPLITIKGQKIDSDGNLLWGYSGKLIGDKDSDDNLSDLISCDDKTLFVWVNESWPNNNIYASLVDSDGELVSGWDENGLEVTGADGNQSEAKATYIDGNILIYWKDERGSDSDIYGQLLTTSGEKLWDSDGKPFIATSGDQSAPSVYPHSDGSFTVSWVDSRTGDEDIYSQRFDSNGDPQWGDSGVIVGTGEFNQTDVAVYGDNASIINLYESFPSAGTSDLYLQLLNNSGEKQIDGNGLVVCNHIRNQNSPQIINLENRNSLLFWSDGRSSGKSDILNIYAQKYLNDVSSIDENSISTLTLMGNYPNPFNPSTTIEFNSQISTEISLTIFNSNGEQLNRFNKAISSGNNSINLDMEGYNSGVYYYKLQVGDEQVSSKMVLIK
jgi:hypothetical protein